MISFAALRSHFKRVDYNRIWLAITCGLVFTYVTIYLLIIPLEHKIAGGRDFSIYWATGVQLVHHANPFDSKHMSQLEEAAGLFDQNDPHHNLAYFMRNPPWTLFLTWPLGFLPMMVGALPWSLLVLGVFYLAIRKLYAYAGAPDHYTQYIAFSFMPALFCVMIGQTGLFVLLGFVLFLVWHKERPYAAGAALWLCTMKPHLAVFFIAVLALWILHRRQFRILAGFLAAFALSVALTLLIDPLAFLQYRDMTKSDTMLYEIVPCIIANLANYIAPRLILLRYLPLAIGLVPAIAFYWLRRNRWDWFRDGGLLLLFSILLTPYGWIYDQGLILPILVYLVLRIRNGYLILPITLSSIAVLVQFACVPHLNSPTYFWTLPFYLCWILYLLHVVDTQPPLEPSATLGDTSFLDPLEGSAEL